VVLPLATGGFGFTGPINGGAGVGVGTAVLVGCVVIAVAVTVSIAEVPVAVDDGAVAVDVVTARGVGVTMRTGTCVPPGCVAVAADVSWLPPMTIDVGDTELPIAD
jgi:hypothetical protein